MSWMTFRAEHVRRGRTRRADHATAGRHRSRAGWPRWIWPRRGRSGLRRAGAAGIAAGLLAAGALAAGTWLAATPASASGPAPSCSNGTCTVTFTETGEPASWTVPPYVSAENVTLYGADGGTGAFGDTGLSPAGLGAEVTASLSYASGTTIALNVGGGGGGGAGGYNGGGAGGFYSGGGGGGGATTVSEAGNLLLEAGGGGGGGGWGQNNAGGDVPDGGAGGNSDTAGVSGVSVNPGATLGGGGGGGAGGQASGGAAGTAGTVSGTFCSPSAGSGASGGSAGQGGAGAPGGNYGAAGGGGGGGYYGGGGGGSGAWDYCADNGAGGGGGGGSSFTSPAVSGAVVTDGANPGLANGNGEVVFSYTDPVATGSPGYATTAGQSLTVPVGSGLLSSAAGTTSPAGDTLSASGPASGMTAADGSVTVDSNGAFSYTPPADFAGQDSFSYTVTDGTGEYATGTATITVQALSQSVSFSTSAPTAAMYGGTYAPAASASSGLPVTFGASGACSLAPDGATVDFTGVGMCTVTASQDGSSDYAAGSASQQFAVAAASTQTTVSVTGSALTATVTAQGPGGGTPSGLVTFEVNGKSIGSAQLSGGTASLAYASSGAETVAAAYAGDTDYLPSSGSTATTNPVITATLTSKYPESRYGWYRAPVTVTFTCAAGSAPLTGPCPAPVTLSGNGAAQVVTETIHGTDGGIATVAVTVNIDTTTPKLSVTGVTKRAVYDGPGPATIKCVASDAVSGLAGPCTLTVKRTATTLSWTASATSKAGVTATVTGKASLLDYYVAGAARAGGRFVVTVGRTYTIKAYLPGSRKAPRYVDAAPAGVRPHPDGPLLAKAGPGLWAIRVKISWPMDRKYANWVLGVLVGKTLHDIPITLKR